MPKAVFNAVCSQQRARAHGVLALRVVIARAAKDGGCLRQGDLIIRLRTLGNRPVGVYALHASVGLVLLPIPVEFHHAPGDAGGDRFDRHDFRVLGPQRADLRWLRLAGV